LRLPSALFTVALTALALGGCGKAGSTVTDNSPSSSAAAPGDSPAGTGYPAVHDATDLKKAPVIQAGAETPETTLVTHDLVLGTGAAAVATNTVRIQYVGALYTNGKVFDATWSRGAQPASFPLNQVVPGFAQGIVGMKIGGRREIVIPPALGYGSTASGPIPANSTLVFIVDLLGVS
jgi:peptidylprolyl isomerase